MPFNKVRRLLAVMQRRRRLKNKDYSIISNTCIGGVITHSLGDQFRSPTVNLIIYELDFITFCQHLREYADCPIDAPSPEEQEAFNSLGYPVGFLRGGQKGLPDITLYFVHYKSLEEAKTKWTERFSRVNYNNLFILMDRGMDAKDDILDLFHALPYRNKVFFTHKENPSRWPNTFRYSYYTEETYKTAYMYNFRRVGFADFRILDEFDFVQWLNDGVIKKTNIFKQEQLL